MRLSSLVFSAAVFVGAAAVSLVAANYSVTLIEDTSEITVREALDDQDYIWAEVHADGLQITLSGIAPTEAMRFAALSTAGTIVDAARVIDAMQVTAQADLAPPRFSLELLRNDAGVSAIGLVPEESQRDEIVGRFGEIAKDAPVTDLLETAAYSAPEGWEDALSFALLAMERLPRAKVSVEAGYVAITAITDSAEEKAALEKALNRQAPPGLRLRLDIAAPRPVITPFTLRFVKDADGARFDACSVDDDATEAQIAGAARLAGFEGRPRCVTGLGIPSPEWGKAVAQTIAAVDALEGGSVTFSDADVTLIALEGTAQGLFDRIVGDLENDLPDVFALQAKLPTPTPVGLGPPEFTATLSPEGQVQLRGRVGDENLRRLTESFAQAAFGFDAVRVGTRLDPALPADWSLRVLTGLEALTMLSNGAVRITPEDITISGNTGNQNASDQIAQLLAAKLGEAPDFNISVVYQKKLDPFANIPTPEECEQEIAGILAISKISFEPGSATIDATALGALDDIAAILKLCGAIRLEIQGHTDSQGREVMNQQLSQARAQSVLNELRARRVLTSTYSAKGYGESTPIADNKTEDGREANRRIEFRLIQPKQSLPEGEDVLETLAKPGGQAAEKAEGASGQ